MSGEYQASSAARIIEACAGMGRTTVLIPNTKQAKVETDKWVRSIARAVEDAQCFLFENFPIDHEDDDVTIITLPGVTREERQMFTDGLIPLPFPMSLFEFRTPGGECFIFLIEELRPGHIRAMPIRLHRDVVMLGGDVWEIEGGFVSIHDPNAFASIYGQTTGQSKMDYQEMVKGEVGAIIYMMLMLVSRSTETTRVEPPAKLNAARVRRGKRPLKSHTVVSIVPKRIVRRIQREEGEDAAAWHRASPRLHWRRSHVRTLASGKRIVIARMLVGYRGKDGAMVEHDYRVKL